MESNNHVTPATFVDEINRLKAAASSTLQRPLVWVTGGRDALLYCLDAVSSFITAANTIQYVSKRFSEPQLNLEIEPYQSVFTVCKHKSHLLGTQTEYLIYDAFDGFDPDLFCMASGTLKAGGLLFLLSPDEDAWLQDGDADYEKMVVYPYEPKDICGRFIARLVSQLKGAEGCSHWDCLASEWVKRSVALSHSYRVVKKECLEGLAYTPEQITVIQSVLKVVNGHRNRPLVVTADRGRGKSSAIGAAIAQLETPACVVVTAPNFENVRVLFEHCLKQLVDARLVGKTIRHEDLELKYLPPDELLQLEQTPSLVVVDEAAGIPEGILKSYLGKFHRMVFSTTIHGYEGTGRGFQIRFEPYLSECCPGWKKQRLIQPIRWGDSDWLEAWLNDTFLLSADYHSCSHLKPLLLESLTVSSISQQDLSECDKTLEQVFGLLMQAHYRTSPGDLRDLLDALNFKIWLLQQGPHLLGCCLIAEEGSMDSDIIDDIERGIRRPKGHLLPQVMCQQLGEKAFPAKKIARVVRIAVAPEFQKQGLGTYLLKGVEAHYAHFNYDAIGSSFSAHPNVVRYWHKNDYLMMRLGFSKEASSGAHSLVVLKPLKENEVSDTRALSIRFQNEFIHLLGSEFKSLPSEQVLAILDSFSYCKAQRGYDSHSLRIVSRFINGASTFENARYALWQCAIASIFNNHFSKLCDSEKELLVVSLLKQKNFKCLQQLNLISGKKAGVERLRDVFSKIYRDTKTVTQPTS